jgi:hypothetical protein
MSKILYKFLPTPYALDALERRELKVSLLKELNDVFDCTPVAGPIEDDPAYLDRSFTNDIIANNPKCYGLACFSRTYSSPVLWGHYAASATGIALGFTSDVFARHQWIVQARFNVHYKKDVPELRWPRDRSIPDEDRSIPDEEMQQLLKATFGIKAKEWSYEKETRVILHLNKCEPRGGRYFVPFLDQDLRRVIIGSRSNLDADYIWNSFARNQWDARDLMIFTSSQNETKFEIEIKQFGQTLNWLGST